VLGAAHVISPREGPGLAEERLDDDRQVRPLRLGRPVAADRDAERVVHAGRRGGIGRLALVAETPVLIGARAAEHRTPWQRRPRRQGLLALVVERRHRADPLVAADLPHPLAELLGRRRRVGHALVPLRRRPLISPTAFMRPMVARLPLSV
jgi:hypothetical protein